MQPLSQDWQAFYNALGPGTATFGLFDLPIVGNQPVLLIHASPDMGIPHRAMLRSTLELYQREGVYVVRMFLEIQSEVHTPRPSNEVLSVFIHDQPRRDTRKLAVTFTPTPLRFETYLNPAGEEDRLILQKLAQAPGLSVSMVQSGNVLWGKQFPWKESMNSTIREILEETKGISPVPVELWQRAKEHVIAESSL